jgi:hypothetical protein
VRFVWLSDKLNSEGEPIIVLQSMTNSLHYKSRMGKTVKAILGKEPSSSTLDGDQLTGAQCQILVSHAESGGRTYANVTSILPRRDGVKVEIPKGWEPPKVRNKTTEKASW